MEKENSSIQKQFQLKVIAQTNVQDILKFFEFHSYLEEFKLSIRQLNQGNHFLQTSFNLLINHKNLQRLIIKLEDILDLNFDNPFRQLRYFLNLKCLTFDISYSYNYSSESNKISLGESIKDLKHLEELNITLQEVQIGIINSLLNLKQSYEHLNSLIKISINLNSLPKSLSLVNLFEGMDNLSNLSHFTYKNSGLFYFDENYYKFCETLMRLEKLKSLTLDLNSKENFSNEQRKMFQRSLLFLKNLEYLEISVNTANENEVILARLNSLENLQQLSFSNYRSTRIQVLEKYLIEIAKCTQLEETQLVLRVDGTLNNLSEDLHRLYQTIAIIPNIKSLKFYFPKNNLIKVEDLFEFLISLKSQKYLKSLHIIITDIELDVIINNNFEDCIELIHNLKEFNVEVERDANEASQYFIDKILSFSERQNQIDNIFYSFNKRHDTERINKSIQFHEILSSNSQLKSFELKTYNSFGFDEIELIRALQNLKNKKYLKKLVLVNDGINQFGQKTCDILSDFLENCRDLSYFRLYLNEFRIADSSYPNCFLNSFKNMNKLKQFYFKLSVSEEFNPIITQLFETLYAIQSIKQLKLIITMNVNSLINSHFSKIQLQPNIKQLNITIIQKQTRFDNMRELFKSLQYLKQVKLLKLDIDFELLALNDLIEIESYLSDLENLYDLIICFNQLTPVYLMNLFQKLNMLNFIDISLSKQTKKQYSFIELSKQYLNNQKIQFTESFSNETNETKNNDPILNQYTSHKIFFSYSKLINEQDIEVLSHALRNNLIKRAHFLLKNQNNPSKNFFQSLQQMKYLLQFEIEIREKSNIQTESFIELANSITNFKQLTNFCIQVYSENNQINWREGKEIFYSVKDLQNLESIRIVIYQFMEFDEQSDLDFVYSNLQNLTKLRVLKVVINCMQNFDDVNLKMHNYLSNLNLISLDLCYFQPIYYLNKQYHLELKKYFENFNSLRSLKIKNLIKKQDEQILFKIKRLVNLSFK